MGTLCAQLLLQFYANLFETLQVFLSWSEDAYGLDIILRLVFISFFFFFLHFELGHCSVLNTIKCIDSGYLVCATPPTALCQSF